MTLGWGRGRKGVGRKEEEEGCGVGGWVEGEERLERYFPKLKGLHRREGGEVGEEGQTTRGRRGILRERRRGSPSCVEGG